MSSRMDGLRGGRRQAGFSAIELAFTLGVLGLLVATSVPMFLTYYQGARLREAAEETAAFLNQARQLGIRENIGVCVQRAAGAMHYYPGSSVAACTGTAAASLALPSGITLTASANQIVFDYLGAATPGTTYTLTNTQDGHSLRVTVATSGRVKVCRETGACT